MRDSEVEEAARRFGLLSDPTRLRILRAVMEQGEMPVHAIAAASGASRFNASAHLNRLAAGGLVARRRVATTVYYRLDDDNMPRICEAMCESLHRRAAAMAAR